MDRAKIGVAGLGRFGVWHARVLAQLPQVELAGGVLTFRGTGQGGGGDVPLYAPVSGGVTQASI